MKRRATTAALVAVALLIGCGGEDENAAVEGAVAQLDDPATACEVLSDDYLAANYGGAGAAARDACAQDVEDDVAFLERSEVIEVSGDCALVSAADSEGRAATVLLSKNGDDWEVDEIAERPDEVAC